MRFSPITEEQAVESARPNYLLKPGECDFEVRRASEETSGAGNPMIKLTLDVWDSTGKKATVYDYLLDAIPHKVRHFAYAVGLGHVYEAGEMDADVLEGKGGRLLIRNKQQQGYDPKNDVADYIVADRTKDGDGYKKAKARDAGNEAAPSTNRRTAWETFQQKHAGVTADEISRLWRSEITSHFGHGDQSKLSDTDWMNFTKRLRSNKVAVPSPISDEQEFTDDSIPF